tara:strand:- start:844 stop:1590 length:747 start_codon:yes stop_codon:yes gene_type:complete
MTQDILITPGSGQPQISFRASGVGDTSIDLNILSRGSSTHPSGSMLTFEGQKGRLLTIGDRSDGAIFTASDHSGLPIFEVHASGYARVGRHGNYFGVGSGVPQYGLDVFASGNFREGVILADKVPASTSNALYNDGGTLRFNGSGIQSTTVPRAYQNFVSDFDDFDVSMSGSDEVVFVNASGAAVNVYIPTAVDNGGKEVIVKSTGGSYGVTIHASGSQTIDGQSSFTIQHNYQSTTLISNNTNWFIY